MFSRYRTKGFVTNKKERGDFDRIITFYTEEFGKIKILGKSIRKGSSKLKSFSEFFSLVEIEFIEGKSIKTLTNIKKINSYLGVSKNLSKIGLAEKFIENLDELINGEEKDLKVWNLLERFFESIDSSEKPLNDYYYYVWSLFSALGYKPDLYFCLKCQSKKFNSDLIGFSSVNGGLICDQCLESEPFFWTSKESIKIIRLAVSGNEDYFKKILINSENNKYLSKITDSYIRFVSSKNS